MEYNKLFIGGDLSGIQKFLYNIVSRKAAVTLKGRSDYLREYMLTICDKLEKVANEAGAKSTKVIYKSGGKFYLITDHTLAITQAIDARVRAIKRELWEQQHGELSINISYVAFSENADQTVNVAETDLMPAMSQAPIGQLWKVVNAAFARQKHQKFKEVLCDQYESLFTPLPVGGQPKICDITGIESDKCVRLEDEDMCVLPSVKAQIELGKRLRKEQGFKEFNDYADLGGGASTYLGILRMDVDGLGKRFITGFRSFDDYQRFSNRLVQFFEKEIVNIQHESVFRDYLNVIYSGGDDLFVVGRWDKTIDFAERVHQEVSTHFRADGISISGGVAIVSPKFPIAKSAEMAGEAEDLAKQYCNGEKNAFHMLGKPNT